MLPLAVDLISSVDQFPATLKVRELVDWFSQHPYAELVAVISDSEIGGIVSRNSLNSKLSGNKFNSAIFSEKSISQVMDTEFLKVEASSPLPELVKQLVAVQPSKQGFCDELAVYDGQRYLGLISIRQMLFKLTLILNQMSNRTDRDDQVLARKNRELVSWVFQVCYGNSDWSSIKTTAVPTIVVDDGGAITCVNRKFLEMTGRSGDLIGLPVAQFLTEQMLHHLLTAEYKPGGAYHSFLTSLAHTDGTYLSIEAAVQFSAGLSGRMLSVIRVLEDDDVAAPTELVQAHDAESEKVSLDQALSRLSSLVEFAEKLKSPTANFRGALGEFSTVDLLQLLIQSQKSGEIRFTYPASTQQGLIYLQRGMVVHAAFGSWKGAGAIRQIIGNIEGEFVFTYDVKAPETTIVGSDPMAVLMEACAEIDEATPTPT